MLEQIRIAIRQYPGQFWLLFWGMLISTVGASMIWPFLMIYVTERLDLPLSTVTLLMPVNSVMGMLFSIAAGPLIDRAGRKWVMVVSLVVNGLAYLLMSQAHTLPAFAALQMLTGAFNPLYRVGADAMMADLIPQEERANAYSLMRMGNNIGVAIGPAAGGFIAASSYTVAFFSAAGGLIFFGLLVAFFARETLPGKIDPLKSHKPVSSGYGALLRDREFVYFTLSFTVNQMAVSILWVLLSVYTKTQYQIPENQYGWLPTTNALLVVAFQLLITRAVSRFRPLPVMALGSLFYSLSIASVAWMNGFWGFWVSMVVMTVGEMILSPTSTTFVANLAPADMRGRYMSIFGLTWPVAAGIGPVLGGWLNDNYSPAATWYGGGLIGLVSVIGFWILARAYPHRRMDSSRQESG